jgi:UDPglucose 6-dehydrogenase
VMVYDPKVPAPVVLTEVLGNGRSDPRLMVAANAYEAAAGAHALVVVTEWDEFKDLDYQGIFASMHQPAFVFDGRNILDLPKLRDIGFRACGIGKC